MIWKTIESYPNYLVSNTGLIKAIGKRKGNPRILKPSVNKKTRYHHVNLYNEDGKKPIYVHVLVCTAFHGPKPSSKYEVNHKNGNRGKNKEQNLEWNTRKENVVHSVSVLKTGGLTGRFGARHPKSKAYTVTSPKGEVFNVKGLASFCKVNALDPGEMSRISNKGVQERRRSRYRHKGWTCEHCKS